MIVHNTSQRSKDYSAIASYYRPGHADYTFDQKCCQLLTKLSGQYFLYGKKCMRVKKENGHLLSAYFFLQAHKDEVNLFTVLFYLLSKQEVFYGISQ